MKLTQEQFDYIAQSEIEFVKAVKENYFRVVNRNMLAEYAKIYKSVFGKDSKILNGCSRCVLTDIKQLAKVYFDDKAELEAQKNIEVADNEEEKPQEPVKAETKKKNKKK